MDERRQIERELEQIKDAMKQLEVRYELYFAGEERREPLKARAEIKRKLLHFSNRRITQTNLRFQFQNLATRFHSYLGYWDRILRLMDEGKYHRHLASIRRPKEPSVESEQDAPLSQIHPLYEQVRSAYADCNMSERTPSEERLNQFIAQQQDKIRRQFGDRPVEFVVITKKGKPVIKARALR